MRDYENMPHLDWDSQANALKAKAQILHQEPIILDLPAGANLGVETDTCGCEHQQHSTILLNCDPRKALGLIGRLNKLPGVDDLIDAAVKTSQVVDIDATHNRIIVHG